MHEDRMSRVWQIICKHAGSLNFHLLTLPFQETKNHSYLYEPKKSNTCDCKSSYMWLFDICHQIFLPLSMNHVVPKNSRKVSWHGNAVTKSITITPHYEAKNWMSKVLYKRLPILQICSPCCLDLVIGSFSSKIMIIRKKKSLKRTHI